MWVLSRHRVIVDRQQVPREDSLCPVRRSGERDVRIRSGRQKDVRFGVLDNLLDIDDADRDRLVRTSLDAGRSLTHSQPVRAHVALPDDAFCTVIFRHVVRAGQRAILTAEALIVQVPHDAGHRILFIRVDRAGTHAARFEAVMAGRRDVLHHRFRRRAANKKSNIAPGLLLIEPVQSVAGGHTGFASRTPIEVHVERVLLPGLRSRRRDERRIVLRLIRQRTALVYRRELLNRGHLLLLIQQPVEEGLGV